MDSVLGERKLVVGGSDSFFFNLQRLLMCALNMYVLYYFIINLDNLVYY